MEVLVVGSGAAGIEASISASKLGLKVTIIDSYDFGGNYLNKTCIPSKLLLSFLRKRNFEEAKALAKQKVLEYKKKNLELFEKYGIEYYKGNFFATDSKFKVHTQMPVKDFRKVILCNGSIPIVPNIKGKDFLDFSTNIIDIKEVPEEVCIIGAGPEGVEVAEIFSLISSKVYLVEKKNRILALEDSDLSHFYSGILKGKGIHLVLNTSVLGIKKADRNYKVVLENGNEIKVNKVISCVGWRSNYDGIESLLKNGRLEVNENLQINDMYFAAGDVVKVSIANIAKFQGRIAGKNVAGMNIKIIDEKTIPHTIFTSPKISTVGLKEKDVISPEKVKIIKFTDVDFKEIFSLDDFYLKLIIKDDKIIGAASISEKADEIINFFSFLLKQNVKVSELESYIPTKPSIFEEIIDKLNYHLFS